MLEVDLTLLFILAAVALLAGFFDVIAGGGGLITLPMLFVAGIDPLAALATNKFQAASATVSATLAFARRGMLDWRSGLQPRRTFGVRLHGAMAACAMLGAQLGARCAVHFGQRRIRPLLICVCCAMTLKLLLDDTNPLVMWVARHWS